MRCNEVIRQLAVPTDDCDPAMLCRASGDMSVVRGLGQACRATRSALGDDSPDRAHARNLGCRMG